eukprot:Tbor_TRINITY_DN4770_c0_g1::TRINITY_DN4770_c0_g1_i2::g.17211::m.17211
MYHRYHSCAAYHTDSSCPSDSQTHQDKYHDVLMEERHKRLKDICSFTFDKINTLFQRTELFGKLYGSEFYNGKQAYYRQSEGGTNVSAADLSPLHCSAVASRIKNIIENDSDVTSDREGKEEGIQRSYCVEYLMKTDFLNLHRPDDLPQDKELSPSNRCDGKKFRPFTPSISTSNQETPTTLSSVKTILTNERSPWTGYERNLSDNDTVSDTLIIDGNDYNNSLMNREFLMLLHQEAAYRKLQLSEVDFEFVSIAEIAWNDRDLIKLILLETANRRCVKSDEVNSMDNFISLFKAGISILSNAEEMKRYFFEECDFRHDIERDAYNSWESLLLTLQLEFEHQWQTELTQRKTLEEAEEKNEICHTNVNNIIRDDIYELEIKELLPLTAKLILHPLTPVPPQPKPFNGTSEDHHISEVSASHTSSSHRQKPSRMQQYKEGRRYRQDVAYRYNAERMVAEKAKCDSVSSDKVKIQTPQNLSHAMMTLWQTESSCRSKIISSRYRLAKTLFDEHMTYLDCFIMGRSILPLSIQERTDRTIIVDEHRNMLIESLEALEAAHRRDIIVHMIQNPTKNVRSAENRSWLVARRKEMSRKDEEYRQGAEIDTEMRHKYFMWEKELLQERLTFERLVAQHRVQMVINMERKEFQCIVSLHLLEFPALLRQQMVRRLLYERNTTVLHWTEESYKNVYLAEASERTELKAEEKEAYQSLISEEVRYFLVARRNELINIDIAAEMKVFDNLRDKYFTNRRVS